MMTTAKKLFFLLLIGVFGLVNPVRLFSEEGYLQVSDLHRLYYATYGNPSGVPVVILHGGPGVGSKEDYIRFFDLDQWYVVMFDQRGAMRSTPFASMVENTPQHSIEDIEALRKHLAIQKWVVFGHSWGSCLALLYGERHPNSCLGFVLEALFLGRDEDIRFFKDLGSYSPLALNEFLSHFTDKERRDLPKACHARLMDPDHNIHLPMARATLKCMLQDSSAPMPTEMIEKIDDRLTVSFIRAFVHYCVHGCFLKPNEILENLSKITHLPCLIVQGSNDTVTFPRQAEAVHQAWPGSDLILVNSAGHSCFEPPIAKVLTEKIASFINLKKPDDPEIVDRAGIN